MSKEPSKADQLRALREAKFERNKKPLGRQESAPAVRLGSENEDRPHERETKVSELQSKAESIQARPSKQPNREGKKPAMAWLDPATAKALKMASFKYEVTQEAIVAEGITAMLAGKYRL